MKKTVFYFFVIATIFAAICLVMRPTYQPESHFDEPQTTKYGAFLAAQHAIYVNDFKTASDLASVFSDVSYETPQRTYYLPFSAITACPPQTVSVVDSPTPADSSAGFAGSKPRLAVH